MALKDERQMIPADNVDNNGTEWSTIGENIRHGAKEFLTGKEMLDFFASAVLGTDSEVVTLECDLSGEKISLSTNHHNIEAGVNGLIFKAPFMVLSVNLNKPSSVEQSITLNYGPGNPNCYLILRNVRQPDIKLKITVGIAK